MDAAMWLLDNPISVTFLTLLGGCALTITYLAIREHVLARRPPPATVGSAHVGVGTAAATLPTPATGVGLTSHTVALTNAATHALEDLLTRVEQTARQIDSSLRSRITELESASRAANERARDLARLAATTNELEQMARQGEREIRSRFETPAKGGQDVAPAECEFDVEALSAPPIRKSLKTPEPPAWSAPRSTDPRTARVCELLEAGTAPINIAEALDMTLGEVELILNLHSMR